MAPELAIVEQEPLTDEFAFSGDSMIEYDDREDGCTDDDEGDESFQSADDSNFGTKTVSVILLIP